MTTLMSGCSTVAANLAASCGSYYGSLLWQPTVAANLVATLAAYSGSLLWQLLWQPTVAAYSGSLLWQLLWQLPWQLLWQLIWQPTLAATVAAYLPILGCWEPVVSELVPIVSRWSAKHLSASMYALAAFNISISAASVSFMCFLSSFRVWRRRVVKMPEMRSTRVYYLFTVLEF